MRLWQGGRSWRPSRGRSDGLPACDLPRRARASPCGRFPHRATADSRLKGSQRPNARVNYHAELYRPSGGDSAGDEGPGRSRGRFTTKLNQSADGYCCALSSSSHQPDGTQFQSVREKPASRGLSRAGPQSPIVSLWARNPVMGAEASACGAGTSGTAIRRRGSQVARLGRGCCGGLPPEPDQERGLL